MSTAVRVAAAVLVLCVVTYGIEWQGMAPPARGFATLTVDTTNHRAVVFGGTSGYDLWNDVWVMPLDTMTGYRWEPLTTSGTPPSGRFGHTAIYDPGYERMVVFGGTTTNGETNELWQLDLSTAAWQQLAPSGTPPTPREFISAVYCPERHSMLVFDGKYEGSGIDELWELELDSLAWHQLDVSGTRPPALWSYGSALDPDSNKLLIFAGQAGDNLVNDVWELDITVGNEHWTHLNPGGTLPDPLSNCAFCYVPRQRCLFAFAGFTYPGEIVLLNDLYELDLNALSWTHISPAGPIPVERRGPAGEFDPWNGNFITFGGQTYDGFLNDAPYIRVSELLGIDEWHQTSTARSSPWILVPAVSAGPVHIRYFLTTAGASCVRIMDNSGRVVRTLHSGTSPAGVGQLTWDGKDSQGRTVATGAYFCYLETEQTGISRKFVFTR